MKQKDVGNIHFFSPPDMEYLQAVCGTNVTNEFPRHIHRKFCIGIVQQRARTISQGNIVAVIPENALFVINPGMSHTCKSSYKEGHSYLAICIDPEKIDDITSQVSGKNQRAPYFENVPLHDSELGWKMRQFFSLIEYPDSTLARESVLFSMLSDLILRYGNTQRTHRRTGFQHNAINLVCDFIKVHYAENLSLEQLSKTASLSSFHFQRMFLKQIGISPHDYLIQLRIKKAREFLHRGHTIASVAFDTGFVDQSHFTRSFKRVIGITPGGYIHSVMNRKKTVVFGAVSSEKQDDVRK